jgi:hypothetical protein
MARTDCFAGSAGRTRRGLGGRISVTSQQLRFDTTSANSYRTFYRACPSFNGAYQKARQAGKTKPCASLVQTEIARHGQMIRCV